MRDRGLIHTSPTRASSRRSPISIDVILLTPRGKQLAALCVRADDVRARERWCLPYDEARGDETLEEAARRIVVTAIGVAPSWMEQLGAFADGLRHPGDSELSVGFVAVAPTPAAASSATEAAWFAVGEPPALAPRQRVMFDAAQTAIRNRMDHAPIAFRLLPPQFTLGELQQTYELLLGKRLHKASFRRALQAAYLVEPIDEWRSEGRGRPAQFFRFAPRKRRSHRRGVRFDLL